ncbi:ribonuclease J [Eubacterium limosum]|uniref:ribonuclease J n=1 Tax=Eubacterium limosum TaxID=1736 RepID=UPI001FA9DD67|nr:ribonuclease J [Eubacterium limosum]
MNETQQNKNENRNQNRQNHRPKRRNHPPKHKDKLKVIPIGGLGEIGKNMTVFEYKDEMIIVDCGLKFPDDEMYGIDIVLPDFSYIVENADKLKGLFITHGHEDHIGGIVYLVKKLGITVPIYATKFTMGLIDKKLVEHRLVISVDRQIVKAGDRVQKGSFEVEFIRVNHSIADSVALYIKTPAATVFHTGDFKIDYHPIDGEIMDLQRIAKLGSQGIDLLMADSTNVEEAGFTPSESSVGATFYNLFRGCKNRIIITTFASNVHRVQQIIDAAASYKRKVIINGRSMENMVEVASDLGYLKIPKNILIDIKDMKSYKDSELVIITTGSQGEPMAALGRMAHGEHRFLNIKKEDTVIISASPVPGNEKMVSEVINKLVDLGSEVVYKKFADIHVSGHARQEELKLVQTLVKPKFFLPVHGEARMLVHHAALAESVGTDKRNILIAENGSVLEVDHRSCKITGKVQAEPVLVDGLGVGDIGNIVLNDRKRLSEDGLFIVVVTMHKGKAISGPDIISRGFVYVRESEELINTARDEVKKALLACEEKGVVDWSSIKNEIRESLFRYLYSQTNRKPMILPILMEV